MVLQPDTAVTTGPNVGVYLLNYIGNTLLHLKFRTQVKNVKENLKEEVEDSVNKIREQIEIKEEVLVGVKDGLGVVKTEVKDVKACVRAMEKE